MFAPANNNEYKPHLVVVASSPVRTGGMQKFSRSLVQTMLSADWRVTVALSGENIYETIDPFSSKCLNIEQVDWVDSTFAGDRDYKWATIINRRKWFVRNRPDVAVFIQSSNTPFRASIIGAKLAGVPMVSTHRTMAWGKDLTPSRKHLFGLMPGLGLHRRKLIFKTWLTAVCASRIVCNSRAVLEGYRDIYGYPKHKGRVIVNAVDVPEHTQKSEPRDGSEITIGYLGRLGREKRLDVLLRAVAQLNSNRPIRVKLYGDGPERSNLQQLAGELGIGKQVTFCGETEDIWSAYAQMDIVVLCSPRESSSNMVAEAMGAGKAVIVTNAGGLPELVDYGRCGLNIASEDVTALSEALVRLIENDEERVQIGQKARELIRTRHHPDIVARQWVDLLNEVSRNKVSCCNNQRNSLNREVISLPSG